MKNQFRLTLALIIIGFCVFSACPPFLEASPDQMLFYLPRLETKIVPPNANEIAFYTFTYHITENHKDDEWIEIRFPPGTHFEPPIPENRSDRQKRLLEIIDALTFADDIATIDCFALQGIPILTYQEDGAVDIRITFPLAMDPFSDRWRTLTVHISKEAGIATPPMTGDYQYAMRTQHNDKWQVSQIQHLIALEPGQVRLRVDIPYVSMNSSYSIDFILESGFLNPDSPLLIIFPPEMSFPQINNNQDIKINGADVFFLLSEYNEFLLYPSIDINHQDVVKIEFLVEAGLHNPLEESELSVRIHFLLDGSMISSNSVLISKIPYPLVSIVIDPIDASDKVDYLVKIVFDENDLPQSDDAFEINLGVRGHVYQEKAGKEIRSIFVFFFWDCSVSPGVYTLKFKWRNKLATCFYTIPWQK